MDRLLRFLALAVVVMLGGCTAMMESSTYGSSDLYITNNRVRVAQELTARAEAQKAEAEARKAMWEARLAEANYYAATSEDYTSIVANDYESAYARRLYGFNSPTYRLPASYYNLATSEAVRYASAYDPAFYNIMVSGDQVWVEPKYVTSMFGTWGATNVTFGIYSSPWVFGWGVYTSPFYSTMWGYPHYSWYDWNWNMCYNPYHWGFGYYGGYYPHYHGHYHPHHPSHPPQYRPNNKPGGGNKYLTNERRNSSSRYTSPTSNKNYGSNINGNRVSSTVRGSGVTSSGINHSRVNGGTSTSGSRYSTISGRSTTKSGTTTNNSNFRSSSSSTSRGTVSNSSSSSSRSSSSNFRSSGGSSSSSRTSSSSSNFRSSGSSSSSGGATSSRR